MIGAAAIVLSAAGVVGLPPVQAVADRYRDAVVLVQAGGRRAQGFFVSSDGLVATVLPGVRVGDVIRVVGDAVAEGGGRRGSGIAGVVVVVDDDGLALASTARPGGIDDARDGDGDRDGGVGVRGAALGVAEDDRVVGRFVVGLSREGPGVTGAAGEVDDRAAARWRLLLPVPRGAPLLDERSVVVAVVVQARGAGRVEAVPAGRLRALARRLVEGRAPMSSTTTPAASTTPRPPDP